MWWDVAATKVAVLGKLRLAGTDVDAPRVESLVSVAGRQINERLDRTTPLPTELRTANQTALETLVIALYSPPVRNPDGSWSDPLDSIRLFGRERRGIA